MIGINLLTPKYLSLFIAIGSLLLMIILFLGNHRRLTAMRMIALSATCLLGFSYFLSQP